MNAGAYGGGSIPGAYGGTVPPPGQQLAAQDTAMRYARFVAHEEAMGGGELSPELDT
jgi:hypothetical protein